jgi:hypothetical protein
MRLDGLRLGVLDNSNRDAVALEKLGIPSAAIITTEFVKETELTIPRTPSAV